VYVDVLTINIAGGGSSTQSTAHPKTDAGDLA